MLLPISASAYHLRQLAEARQAINDHKQQVIESIKRKVSSSSASISVGQSFDGSIKNLLETSKPEVHIVSPKKLSWLLDIPLALEVVVCVVWCAVEPLSTHETYGVVVESPSIYYTDCDDSGSSKCSVKEKESETE
jgi:hypothetical protein